MADLIDRQVAIAAIQNLYPDMPKIDVFGSLNRWREKNKQYIECEYVINILPSVKLKKGKWIPFLEEYHDMFKCSNCGNITRVPFKCSSPPYYYCPNCGADMREEKADG